MPGQAPPHTDETDLLLAYVAQQRDGLRYAAYGLTDEQMRQAPTAGTLTIGGLLQHAVVMERSWIDTMLQRPRTVEGAWGDDFHVAESTTSAELLADLDACAAETEVAARSVAMDDPVPIPKGVPWFPQDIDHWSVRWVLLHLVEELARHAGHADIVRESIDGATMYELMAGAEGWPATEWITPWQPTEPTPAA